MRPPQPQVRRGRAEPVQTPGGQSRSEPGKTDDPALRETAELIREREQLLHAIETRPTIDMALGVLMAGFTCQQEDAWEILVEVSQHSNVKLREVAEVLTRGASGQPIPADLKNHLAAAVKARRGGHGRGSSG
ncbi:ANTAR domain-containing protein [Streptomyces chartreusis]|uniref:ANTAR domain-containing protein n=1 Tax=Streptomyces chartreusis TaxID=1969 RepID=UPI0035DA1602